VEHELVVRNTLLLRTYQEIDKRAWQLIMLVKVWAKQAGVADASHGTLSSYAWALLTIFYLQQCDPPVLPTLQSEELAGEGSAWHRPASAETENWATSFCEDQVAAKATLADNPNTQAVAELLCGFFQYYGWTFPCVNASVFAAFSTTK
jgi:DNA polymerase sigma